MTDPSGCAGSETALSVARAREILLDAIAPVAGWESVPIRSALGRVLMRDVVAPFDVPAHDNSAMDGYAVRAQDLAGGETRLAVVGTAYAGGAFSGVVGPGQSVRVMTGAVLPRGADSIVVQEAARLDGDAVILPAIQRIGQHVRRAGEDLAAGKPALLAGKKIGPAELGLMASLGYAEVAVRRRPRIAFFSTGDELASIGRPLAPGEVYDSNRYTLFGVLTRLGVEVLDMGVVRDDPAALERAFAEAAVQADAILTTGGVSVGEADYVKDIMARLGEVHFWKIDIKLHGVDPLLPRPSFRVPCTDAIRKVTGRREFPRGVLFQDKGEWRVRLSGNQGSGVLRSMVEANCFVILPEGSGHVAAGDLVEVQPFDGVV
jgi:molybdopterin molybdotransferase